MANPIAVFETSLGGFAAEILVDQMPATGGKFLALAREGFYDGLHFHRVVPGFMVLTGCPFSRDPGDPRVGSGTAPGGPIPDEFIARLSNLRGTLAMANEGRPNTGSSQFFVNLADNTYIDWFAGGPSAHAVFGRVTRGMGVVDAIGRVETDEGSPPLAPVALRRVSVEGA